MLIVAQEIPLGKGNHLRLYLFTERQACDRKAKLCIKVTGPNCSNLHTATLASSLLGTGLPTTCPPLEGHTGRSPALGRSGGVTYPVSENHPRESWVFGIIKVLATFTFG